MCVSQYGHTELEIQNAVANPCSNECVNLSSSLPLFGSQLP